MNNQLKRLTVSILKNQYTIVSDEQEEFVLRSARLVDESMRNVLKEFPDLSVQYVAIMVALRFAFQQEKSNNKVEVINQQVFQIIHKIECFFTSHALEK